MAQEKYGAYLQRKKIEEMTEKNKYLKAELKKETDVDKRKISGDEKKLELQNIRSENRNALVKFKSHN